VGRCRSTSSWPRPIRLSPHQERINELTARSIASGEAQKVTRRLITIPVVVHVVYKRAAEKISKGQIRSQIKVLNRDFRATNPDRSNVPDPWKSLVGDAKIEFALAKKDPRGRPTDGITRTETELDAFSAAGDPVKKKSAGGVAAWPTNRYLNIWVCNLARDKLARRWIHSHEEDGPEEMVFRPRGLRLSALAWEAGPGPPPGRQLHRAGARTYRCPSGMRRGVGAARRSASAARGTGGSRHARRPCSSGGRRAAGGRALAETFGATKATPPGSRRSASPTLR
jgi:hypothetical protein